MNNLKTKIDDYIKLNEAQAQFKIEGAALISGVQKLLYEAAFHYNVKIEIQKETDFLDVIYHVLVNGERNDINNYVGYVNRCIENHKNNSLF